MCNITFIFVALDTNWRLYFFSFKVQKACERISENVHICANEPSLAFYRLAEHVRKALPPTVESRVQVKRLHQQLLGVYYDAEYGLE